MKQKYIKISILLIVLVLFDQFVKLLVVNNIGVDKSLIIINNFLEFTYIKNSGSAFGLFSEINVILPILTIIFIIYILKELKMHINDKLMVLSFILIISGAIGNLIDRLKLGYVVDFIYFKIFNVSMPIFNIADIFITFGILMYICKIIKDDVK